MTEEQERAMAWLRAASATYSGHGDDKHRATILAMLAEPRLPRPEDVPLKVLRAMSAEHAISDDNWVEVMRAAYRALYDHYTAPRIKTVEVWRVEYAYKQPPDGPWFPRSTSYETKEKADHFAGVLAEQFFHANIRVTGPHQQEVPDDAR